MAGANQDLSGHNTSSIVALSQQGHTHHNMSHKNTQPCIDQCYNKDICIGYIIDSNNMLDTRTSHV